MENAAMLDSRKAEKTIFFKLMRVHDETFLLSR